MAMKRGEAADCPYKLVLQDSIFHSLHHISCSCPCRHCRSDQCLLFDTSLQAAASGHRLKNLEMVV
ncbi:unnamed protein product [Prunus armeniaca]|uniref:Uncharacterized protein n=1 Tax=Prunus armeniaca TaxID=36596 RepID=A0A6J5U782_PRUAR|nr:unnamed protein product [Prunus armeniaca]